MRHTFHTEQWLPYPKEQVFAFFADPANLPPLMPRWQRARVERSNYVPPIAGEGSLITISFRPIPLIPLRLEWDAYIAEFRWNEFFCDEQRRGPFHYFRHCHRVRQERNGTVISDAVEYELPLGKLGDLANTLAMKRQIRQLFNYLSAEDAAPTISGSCETTSLTCNEARVPHISLVFREMWDSTAADRHIFRATCKQR